ncbi:MAG TPA: methyltransferase, FxLD system [Trebonia sp.]|nr:methyltransferase, FxLD system [Trebonia sp.]
MATQADRLRDALVDRLLATGMVRTRPVEMALRAVPRHVFLPGVPARQAYANDVTATKRDADGTPISAASQPSIVAAMLEQLGIVPGDRILEIGAGTGYNAALLAHLAGPDGTIVTIDVDEDIVAGARAALRAADCPDVTVVRGDGALGYAPGAPYDRIIATVGARDVPLAWQDQLVPDGRIVLPLRLRGSVTRSIAFEWAAAPGGGRVLRSVSSEMCGFMPMRASIASDPRLTVPLTADADVLLEVQQEQVAAIDQHALEGVLDRERAVVWTGAKFGDAGSTEWLYLWLTCTVPGGLLGLSARESALDRGLLAPMFRWGAMAAVDAGSLAYLTFGPADDAGLREVGVTGHGPHGRSLAEILAEQIGVWCRKHRPAEPWFEIRPRPDPSGPGSAGPDGDVFTFPTPANVLVIYWH